VIGGPKKKHGRRVTESSDDGIKRDVVCLQPRHYSYRGGCGDLTYTVQRHAGGRTKESEQKEGREAAKGPGPVEQAQLRQNKELTWIHTLKKLEGGLKWQGDNGHQKWGVTSWQRGPWGNGKNRCQGHLRKGGILIELNEGGIRARTGGRRRLEKGGHRDG